MKIQTSVLIDQLFLDSKSYDLEEQQTADLEFSAIDTGGGFHDPILDVSFRMELNDHQSLKNGKYMIAMQLRDFNYKNNSIRVEYEGFINKLNNAIMEGSGRLKEDQITKKMMTFIMKSFK